MKFPIPEFRIREFFIREAYAPWKATRAKTLAGAKRAAAAAQFFQGTDLFVGALIDGDDQIRVVAQKIRPNALNSALKGRWEDLYGAFASDDYED